MIGPKDSRSPRSQIGPENPKPHRAPDKTLPNRRQFVHQTVAALSGLSVLGGSLDNSLAPVDALAATGELNVIGPYGQWAASLTEGTPPSLSLRSGRWKDLDSWHTAARTRTLERMGVPEIGATPVVTVHKQYSYDGLHIEELSWQLPYGRPTGAILLKPQGAEKPLPGILAFHDHGGNKYFGRRKITRTSAKRHSLIEYHQDHYYEGRAWANEVAKRGYVVLVSDAFPFESRRVLLSDVPEHLRRGLNDDNPEDPENIEAYNQWAGDHESIMAKSLFCAGTTWPGVFYAEDTKALDVLCAREDVDSERIGCGGLSGGGMRTVFTGGLDPRIKCAVCVGFMTTWKDFLLNKSFTHTWMTYVPLLPRELDFPEILGLRVPLPTLVLNDADDFLYTMPEMTRADEILAEIYAKAGAAERYKCSFYPGPHKFDIKMQEEAFAWYDKWLKD
jgi:dienelactone hydrolase